MWVVPPAYRGETAFLLAGGPSLAAFDVERLRGRGRVVAINTSYRLAPWADLLFWADARWYGWHKPEVEAFPGPKATVWAGPERTNGGNGEPSAAPPDALRLRWDRKGDYSTDRSAVCGRCAGSMALNLAALHEPKRIVLLGYDMKPAPDRSHWHGEHPVPTKTVLFEKEFIPAFRRMAPFLAGLGIEVVNANRNSALDCFPKIDIEELL